jgi:hypothetical protein
MSRPCGGGRDSTSSLMLGIIPPIKRAGAITGSVLP